MESYCNMNSPNERNYRRSPNQNYRNYGNQRRMMHDGMGRSMEVTCVCKAAPKKNCHRDDPMEKLGNQFPPVMAYVPWQQWGELYDADCALMQGTIFKELNLIFCGTRC